MKKLEFLTAWAVSIMMLLSCSSNNHDVPLKKEQGVVFGANIISLNATNHNPKDGNTQWQNGDAIGVYALYSGQSLPAGIYDGKENIKFTTKGDGNFTSSDTKIKYPKDDALDFIAYAPYQNNINNYEYAIDVTSQNEKAIDMLYTNNVVDATEDSGKPNLMFSHQLTMLVLNVKAGSNITDLDGLNISISGLKTDGKVNLSNGNVIVGETIGSIQPNIEVIGKTGVAKAILVPNQDLHNAKVSFSLGENLYEWLPDSQTLEGGKKYLYTLSLNAVSNKVEVETSASIVDWVTEDKGDVSLNPKDKNQFKTDKTKVVFDAKAGNKTVVLTAKSNQKWTATSSDNSWLTVTSSGKGSGDIILTATENTTSNKRVATVTIKATDTTITPIIINVEQSPKDSGSNEKTTVETFDNLDIKGKQYVSGSFVGVEGITWQYKTCRSKDKEYPNVKGNALILQSKQADSKITSSVIPKGIKSFKVKLYKAFKAKGNRMVEVFVNGVSKGKSEGFDDADEHIFEVKDINVSGDFVLEIKNKRSKQVMIDDITWVSMDE